MGGGGIRSDGYRISILNGAENMSKLKAKVAVITGGSSAFRLEQANTRWPPKARVTVRADGSALVEAGTHDLGTGTYTVMQQVAADTLGLPLEKVTVRIGDTRLPKSHASIGSATLANAGASIMLAAKAT